MFSVIVRDIIPGREVLVDSFYRVRKKNTINIADTDNKKNFPLLKRGAKAWTWELEYLSKDSW